MQRLTLVVVLALGGCTPPGGDYQVSDEPRTETFLNRWGALGVPLEGRIVYGRSLDDVTCTPPTWSSVHPDTPEFDWIPIRRGTLADVGRAHDDAPTAGEVFVAVRTPNLLEEDASLFAIGHWGGSEIACNGVTLTTGAPIIIGGFHGERELTPPFSDAEWTVLLDEQADRRAVVDLDVAVDVSE